MTAKKHNKPTKRELSLAALGQTVSAAPPVRERMEIARAQLEGGVPEERVRADIVAWAEAEGLAGPRVVLPVLTRKLLRMDAVKLIDGIATELKRKVGSKKVGDYVAAFMDKVGFEKWLADHIIDWAKTGEPGDFYEGAVGRVFQQRLGFGEDAQDGVVAMATPYSDPRELAQEFLAECARVLPDSTWSRYGADPEAARLFRLYIETRSYAEVARMELGPERLAGIAPAVAQALVNETADRIRKKVQRFADFLRTEEDDELSG